MKFLADHAAQIGFNMAGFDYAPQGVINECLIAPVASQRLEVFDNGRVQHDIEIGSLRCRGITYSLDTGRLMGGPFQFASFNLLSIWPLSITFNHDELRLVTRNQKDFDYPGLEVVNPWD